jgi:hypothetical protein
MTMLSTVVWTRTGQSHLGVQELEIIFPDAAKLDSIRRFAKEFLA